MRDELHPENLSRELADFVDGFCKLHPAAFAAAAGMDLRFDDPNRTAQRFRRLDGFVDRECRNAAWNRHRVAAKDFFSLIFVNLHAGSFLHCAAPTAVSDVVDSVLRSMYFKTSYSMHSFQPAESAVSNHRIP